MNKYLKIISGDLLDASEKYILHQCNSISKGSAGLAKQIFDKYPYANCYFNRSNPDEMGSIKIFGNGIDQRFVINAIAQYNPGPPKEDSDNDTSLIREKAFHKCLLKIAKIENLESIAIPYGIGTGLSNGDPNHYWQMLENFAKYVVEKYNTKVIVYFKTTLHPNKYEKLIKK